MIDISVVIVTWNSANEIARCLGSIFNNSNTDNLKIEVIVIDNNSQDETINILKNINHPGVHICENSTNTGYTQGTNKGINLSQGKYILLLNPDTELMENCIRNLYDHLVQNQGYAASAPLLLNEDGSTQYSVRNFPTYWSMFCEFSLLAYIFPKSRLFGGWKMKYFEYEKDSDINQPMAAALIVKKEVLDKIGNMDERFIMFFNDVDLCKRIPDNGYKIRFIPSAKAAHKKGISVYKDRVRMIKTWERDCIQYFNKYYNNPVLLTWLKISLKISDLFRILFYRITHI